MRISLNGCHGAMSSGKVACSREPSDVLDDHRLADDTIKWMEDGEAAACGEK